MSSWAHSDAGLPCWGRPCAFAGLLGTSPVIRACDDRAAQGPGTPRLHISARGSHSRLRKLWVLLEGHSELLCHQTELSLESWSAWICVWTDCSTCNPFVCIFSCLFIKWAYWHGQFEVISKCLSKVSLKPIKKTIWSVSKIWIHLAKEIMTPGLCVQSNIPRLLQLWISSVCIELERLLPKQGSTTLQK